jgi:hypothetical protein
MEFTSPAWLSFLCHQHLPQFAHVRRSIQSPSQVVFGLSKATSDLRRELGFTLTYSLAYRWGLEGKQKKRQAAGLRAHGEGLLGRVRCVRSRPARLPRGNLRPSYLPASHACRFLFLFLEGPGKLESRKGRQAPRKISCPAAGCLAHLPS